ncbi:HAD-IIA family hydrolase [Paenibacillus sp. JSM ZJ436]|uniref:HAD-IIA family hydrolase n=1 Tax=Paenibacillus sp. JSM ZJ436 TaxID=3376190 RepID=UPI0037A01D86
MHRTLINEFTAYLFDLDGTIYIGDRVLDGAEDTIRTLRERRKSVMFATNTTLYTRKQVMYKLARLGIHCSGDEIITALTAAGEYFREHAPGASIYPLGGEAMTMELTGMGLNVTQHEEDATHVLVGLDQSMNYRRLTATVNAVRNGAFLVAANPDPFCPVEKGVIPDTWALISAIETASGRTTDIRLGKPSAYYAACALKQLGVRPEDCLMVGDKLETDIALGQRVGMSTALVLTGVDAAESIEQTGIQPDYILRSVGVIAEHFRSKESELRWPSGSSG